MNFASLSPTLLARKGGAKPAMRRQSPMIAGAVTGAQAHQPAPSASYSDDDLEDLGWNDLGEEQEAAASPQPASIEQAPTAHTPANDAQDEVAEEGSADSFAKLGQHAQSKATAPDADVASEDAQQASEKVTPIRKGAPRLPRPKLEAVKPAAPSKGKRTAFTLRLDPDRHLKLRMACTLANRSAQALVTEAVDAMFADFPELDQLVARVASRTQSHPSKEG